MSWPPEREVPRLSPQRQLGQAPCRAGEDAPSQACSNFTSNTRRICPPVWLRHLPFSAVVFSLSSWPDICAVVSYSVENRCDSRMVREHGPSLVTGMLSAPFWGLNMKQSNNQRCSPYRRECKYSHKQQYPRDSPRVNAIFMQQGPLNPATQNMSYC